MRILIVKLGSIGDIVHTMPALAAIRREMPASEISWVVEERSAEILRGSPAIDNLIEVDTHSLRGGGGRMIEKIVLDAGKQLRNLRQYTFDVAIDFQGLLKSGMVAKLSGARKRWGFSRSGLREPASRILLTNAVRVPQNVNVVRKQLYLAAGALGFAYDDTDLEFPIGTTSEHLAEADTILQKVDGKFAVLNPAGGWVTKLWPPDKFGGLADRLWAKFGLTSILVSGPKEGPLAAEVAANSHSGKLILAEPSLKGFYELVKGASVYVGGDTGPTHIAVAASAPVVGLYGPTEWWRNGSPRPDDVCVERDDIACRIDCNRRTCSKWICMDSDVETVLRAVTERLRRAGQKAHAVSPVI